MRIIHCTQKLLKEINGPTVELSPIEPVAEGLGNWYANIIRIERRKCLMFTNESTLYTFLIPKVVKANLLRIESEFTSALAFNLQAEGLGPETVDKILREYEEIGFAKTASKQVLGCMNEFAFHYEFLIEREGGLDGIRILEINKKINRTLMSPLKYKHPIEKLRELLEIFLQEERHHA